MRVIELLIPAKRRGVKPIRNLLLSFTTANHPISLSALADSACRHVARRGAGDLLDKDRPVGAAPARAVGVYRPGRCIYVVNLLRACSIFCPRRSPSSRAPGRACGSFPARADCPSSSTAGMKSPVEQCQQSPVNASGDNTATASTSARSLKRPARRCVLRIEMRNSCPK